MRADGRDAYAEGATAGRHGRSDAADQHAADARRGRAPSGQPVRAHSRCSLPALVTAVLCCSSFTATMHACRSAMRGFYAELNGTNRDVLTQYRVRRRHVQELTGAARAVNLAVQHAACLRGIPAHTSCALYCTRSSRVHYSLSSAHIRVHSDVLPACAQSASSRAGASPSAARPSRPAISARCSRRSGRAPGPLSRRPPPLPHAPELNRNEMKSDG